MFRSVAFLSFFRALATPSRHTRWIPSLKPQHSVSAAQTSFPVRMTSRLAGNAAQSSSTAEVDEVRDGDADPVVDEEHTTLRKNCKGKLYNPVDLAKSLEYMNSEVYRDTYRGKPVWFYYRRNFKGHFAPPKTRPNCVVGKKLISSNPCPICRDEYLILDYRNTELLRHFINPITLEIFETKRTGLCQHQHKKLLLEIAKAQDLGTIEMWLPFQLYDYSEYFSYLPEDQLNELKRLIGSGQLSTVDGESSMGDGESLLPSSTDLAQLPVNLQHLLMNLQLIPRASLGQPSPPESIIERPKVPNRYKMEEDHKAFVAKRKKSRTLIIS